MIYYIFAITWAYVIALSSRRLPVIFSPLLLAPIVAFSAFREKSGKDTPLYLYRFYNFDYFSDGLKADSEPLLSIIIATSHYISENNHEVFFMLHSLVVTSMFYFISKKRDASRFYLLTVGPVFLVPRNNQRHADYNGL